MTGEVTRLPPRGGGAVALAQADENAVSSSLWWALYLLGDPQISDGDPEVMPKAFPPAVQAEAAAMLQRIAPLCQAAGADVALRWAEPLLMGITAGSKASDDERAARLRLICLAIQDLAVGAFTADAQRHIARTQTYSPMASTLFDALAPRSRELRGRLELLRRIVDGPTELPAALSPSEPPRVGAPVQAQVEAEVDADQIRAEVTRQLSQLARWQER